MTSVATSELTTPNIGGTGATVGTNYRAGILNYTTLDQNGANFKDPSTNSDYVVGVTTRNGGNVFQLAAKVEGGGTATALVTGNFVSRAPTFSGGVFNLGSTGSLTSSMTLSQADIGELKVGDTISILGATSASGVTVISVSANQLNIGLTAQAYTGTATGITYIADTAGLIDANSTNTGAVTNGGLLLPY